MRIPKRLEINTQRLLKRLLTKDPYRRLGSPKLGGHMAIRNHPFFKDTDWFDTYLRKVKPPLQSYIANNIKSDNDLTNFDNLPDAKEEITMTEDNDNELENELFRNFSYCDPDF